MNCINIHVYCEYIHTFLSRFEMTIQIQYFFSTDIQCVQSTNLHQNFPQDVGFKK